MKTLAIMLFLGNAVLWGQSHLEQFGRIVPEFNQNKGKIDVSSWVIGTEREIDLFNRAAEGTQVLRFKINDGGTLLTYHCGIAFILYDFTPGLGGWIRKISTYDVDGKIRGSLEFDDVAIIELVVNKPETLGRKLELINYMEGNIQMKDEAEQIVLQREINSKGEIISERFIETPMFWRMQNMMWKP